MASNRGKRKPYQVQQGPQASDVDAMFEELYRRVTELEDEAASGSNVAHNLLSADHPDTTPASEVDGDLIVGQGGKWARKAVGTNGQHLVVVAGGPQWSNDGSGLDDLDATELVGTVPTASVIHNLLSAHHPDTTVASPLRGALVKGTAGSASDLSKFWLDGLPVQGVPVSADSGTQQFWIDGLPNQLLAGTGPVTWQRKTIGASGTVPVSDGTDWDWQDVSSSLGSVGAKAYRSTDLTLLDRTATAVQHAASADDDAGYWSAGSPTRLTVPVGQDGWHAIVGQAGFTAAVAGIGEVAIYLNGTKVAAQSGQLGVGASAAQRRNVATLLKLVAGDYVELYVETTMNVAGTSETIVGGSTVTFMQIAKL